MRELLVILPASTAYRAPFFDRVVPVLGEQGIRLSVAHGTRDDQFASRGDVVERSWSVRVPVRSGAGPGRRLEYRRWKESGVAPDLVIVQQALKSLETYPLLARSAVGGARVAMWGHGKSYSTPQGHLAAGAKQWLTRRADWFFAYTQAGADHVIAHGFPATRVSVLNNTIDTDSLRRDLDSITRVDVQRFSRLHGLTPGRTALFLGGVDRAKGVDFLLESARHAATTLPGFVLLVGGAGADLPKVQAAQAAGAPIRALGRLDGVDKALALTAADAMAIPEWIGLVAVDSLVAGRPIVSTWHSSHSPENEYLQPGMTATFVEHDPRAYAHGLARLLTSPEMLLAMQQNCVVDSAQYSIDHMVDAFAEGVVAWQAIVRARSSPWRWCTGLA